MKPEIAIIGAGYVGVPLAQVFADAGRRVVLVRRVILLATTKEQNSGVQRQQLHRSPRSVKTISLEKKHERPRGAKTVRTWNQGMPRSIQTALAAVAVFGLLLCNSAPAATATRSSGYAVEAAVAQSIASYGITYASIHLQIARGTCHGLTRFGVRRSGTRVMFHRLYCNLTARDGHVYDAQVLIVRSSSKGFSWRILSGKRRS